MKTRLSPPLTPEEAAALSVAMAEDLMERLTLLWQSAAVSRPGWADPDDPISFDVHHFPAGLTAKVAPPFTLELRYSGTRPRDPADDSAPAEPSEPESGARGLEVPAGWSPVPQGEGSLGDRLVRAAAAAASEGVERLVIVGADAPLLPLSLVERAFTALRDRPVALAPADDGGYVLLGLATGRLPPASVPSLLREVPWGTAEVCEATRRNAATAGLEVAVLPSSWDVDRPEDLTRLRRAVAALPAPDRPRRVDAFFSRSSSRAPATT